MSLSDERKGLLQLLKSLTACAYCDGWGRIWFREGQPVKVAPKWGYTGWPMPSLGMVAMGTEVRRCPICKGSGFNHAVDPKPTDEAEKPCL